MRPWEVGQQAEIQPRLTSRWFRDFVAGAADLLPLYKAALVQHYDASHHFIQKPSPNSDHQIGLFCTRCRCHFVVTVEGSRTCRGTGDPNKNTPHHLVPVDVVVSCHGVAGAPTYHEKYNPVRLVVKFSCSANPCDFSITIEVAPQRIRPSHLMSFMNADNARRRYEEAVANDMLNKLPGGNGYAGWDLIDADRRVSNLKRILGDLADHEGGGEARHFKTSTNGRFHILFGENDLADMLRDLEMQKEEGEDGSDVWSFPEPETDTAQRRRSYYRDCELEALATMGMPDWEGRQTNWEARLRWMLGVERYPKTSLVINGLDPGDRKYADLGVVGDESDAVLKYALDRQIDVCPSMGSKLADHLAEIGNVRQSEGLQLHAMIKKSTLDTHSKTPDGGNESPERKKAIEAFEYLAVAPAANERTIIEACDKRIRDSPADRARTLEHLLAIGQWRQNNDIQEHVAKRMSEVDTSMNKTGPMTAQEAAGFLDVSLDLSADSIVNISLANAAEKEQTVDKARLLEALIAIRSHLVQLNFSDLSLMSQLADKINQLTMADRDAPVGLQNIGNTCYLNSILQYLYTVRPVRHILDTLDEGQLGTTKQDAIGRRIGSNRNPLNRAEAIAARECVKELASLFHQLDTATTRDVRPKQRMADAALLSVDALLHKAKKMQENENTSGDAPVYGPAPRPPSDPTPPALPPRPSAPVCGMHPLPSASETLPPVPEDDTIIGDAPDDIAADPELAKAAGGETLITDHQAAPVDLETASNTSTQTLVESDQSYVRVPSANTTDDAAKSSGDAIVGEIAPSEESSSLSEIASDEARDPETTGTSDDVDMVDAPSADGIDPSAVDAGNQGEELQATEKTQDKKPEDDEYVEDLIVRALDKGGSGTPQQDVEEIMNMLLFRLQAGIKPSGYGNLHGSDKEEDQFQLDPIIESFYSVIVTQTAKDGDDPAFVREVAYDQRLTAYPAEAPETRTLSLYEALSRTFDIDFVDGTTRARHSVIRRLPPLLHILVQRSRSDGGKNLNRVDIPTLFYMDRYVEEDDPDSELPALRQQCWKLQRQIRQLRNGNKDSTNSATETDVLFSGQAVKNSASEMLAQLCQEIDGIDSDDESDSTMDIGQSTDADNENETSQTTGVDENKNTDADDADDAVSLKSLSISVEHESPTIESLQNQIEKLWAPHRKFGYRLHAIICHMGAKAGVGHYWVFIFDFEKQKWWRYNDDTVKCHTQEEMEEFLLKGQPYYLAYVSEEAVGEYVKTPERTPLVYVDATDESESLPALIGPQNQEDTMMADVPPSYEDSINPGAKDPDHQEGYDWENGDGDHTEGMRPLSSNPMLSGQVDE